MGKIEKTGLRLRMFTVCFPRFAPTAFAKENAAGAHGREGLETLRTSIPAIWKSI